MITESWYWKDDIQKITARITKRKMQKRWTERTFVNLEKDLFISFYAIRKLLEAKKLTTSVSQMQMPAFCYPAKGHGVTHFNTHRIDEHFDLSSKEVVSLSLEFVCNQFIHSYIYMPYWTDTTTLGGFFLCSDRERNEKLYRLEVDTIIDCLERVASDVSVSAIYTYDESIKDFQVVQYGPSEGPLSFLTSKKYEAT